MLKGVVAGSVLLAAMATGVAGQGTSPRRAYCASEFSQKKIFLSGIFSSTASAGDLANLFGSHLQKSFGYKATGANLASCFELASAAAAAENKRITEERYRNGGKQVVETNWSPSQAEASKLR